MCSAGVMTKHGEKQSVDNLANKQSLLNPKKLRGSLNQTKVQQKRKSLESVSHDRPSRSYDCVKLLYRKKMEGKET